MDFMSPRSLGDFQDLLADRYGTSDFMWMSRRWKPTKPHKQDHKTNPYKIKQDVLNSATVSYAIEEVSREKNVSKEKLYVMAQEILDEIGYSRETAIIRWLGIILLKVLKKTCNGFMVNECNIRRVISTMGDNPMIFAPSHRTYADFILMHYLCFHYDLEVPAIAAGIDFYSMWLMGRILRDCGAFFMRRSFNNDKFYWTIFSEYVQKLVTDGEAAIEFFIEGTRSRSAKSLMPKFGFLSMTLMPFFTGRVPDITVVPINISYDRTLEEVLFAYELLGVPKPKESTSALLKALRMLDEKYGKVHFDFGHPISVRELCVSNGFQRLPPTPQSPQVMRQVTASEMSLCVDLAHRIVRQQQQLSVLSPFNIMAILLNNSVMEARGPPLLADMIADVSWFKSVLEVLGALVDIKDGIPEVEAAVKEAISVHKSLVMCTTDGHLKIIKVHSPTAKIDPAKMKGHLLTEKTMDIAVSMVMLQHYANPCLHYLINPALVTLILRHLNRGEEISREDLFQKFNFLRALFNNEFSFYSAWAEKDFADALKHLEILSVVEPTKSGGFSLGNHAKLQSMLCNLLLPFLEGYLTVCQALPQIAEQPSSEGNLLKAIQCRVEELLSSAAVRHPYALSLDMHSAALHSLASMQAVSKLRNGNGTIMYQARSKKLSEIAEELENLAIHCEEKQHLAEFGADHFMMQRSQAKL